MSARSKKAKQAEPGNNDAPQKQDASTGTGEDTPVAGTPDAPLVVGIGASAGGLEAYKAFFDAMEAGANMTFVLVQHLSPDHGSMLVDLLARHTKMVVQEATDGTSVQADHVYVIPPDATLTISDGVLQLTKPAPPRQYRWPIDSFFVSLAEDQGDHAVAVVLSGSGSDGARGLRAVKERGGLTIAQAGFDHVAMSGMPASAAATGVVDHVLQVEEMPARLLAHYHHLQTSRRTKGPDGTRQDLAAHLQVICGMLRTEVGHDFSQYKEKTLIRRIQRRMQVAQSETVHDYIDHLKQNPRELENLFRELLIGVTEFFRDPEAFDVLQHQAIPHLLADKGAADILRVWVPACATGEEAYSIAIALAEAIAQHRGGPKVQIFATDIDDRAINLARSGRFRGPLPAVSAERLERWFIQDGEYFVVVKPIREMVVFSPHSAIKDPPFSRLDLVSCRNLLIYLNSELQEHLVRTFHYALRAGGVLMLGPSESLGRNTALFSVLDKKHRLYVRRSDGRGALPIAAPKRLAGVDQAVRTLVARTGGTEDVIERNARRALEKHAPAYVVIDGNHDVLRFFGDTGRYLGPSTGAASLNLFALLHKGLRGPARTAVQQALARQATVVQEGQMAGRGGDRIPVRLIAEPIFEQEDTKEERRASTLCLLIFKELTPVPQSAAEPQPAAKGRSAKGETRRIQELELELATTREQLHTAIDELETANEEMKSANEEYQSVNEELQSSNEELETSKEEMQSINEELQTVNVELNSKNEALGRLNSDLQNLLESTQIATLFLDSSLHVSGFTPAISDLFHLREGDHGRPITEITARIPYPQLRADVKQVLRTLAMVERVLHGGVDGAVYLLRMRPYRTTDNVIDGVVLTFIDITERQQNEYERGRLAAIVESSQDAIIGHGLDGTISSWNAGAERMFGYPASRAIGKSMAILLPPNEQPALKSLLAACAGEHTANDELVMTWLRQDGTEVPVSLRCSPVLDPSGAVIGGSTIARDTSERRRAARRLQESERRLGRHRRAGDGGRRADRPRRTPRDGQHPLLRNRGSHRRGTARHAHAGSHACGRCRGKRSPLPQAGRHGRTVPDGEALRAAGWFERLGEQPRVADPRRPWAADQRRRRRARHHPAQARRAPSRDPARRTRPPRAQHALDGACDRPGNTGAVQGRGGFPRGLPLTAGVAVLHARPVVRPRVARRGFARPGARGAGHVRRCQTGACRPAWRGRAPQCARIARGGPGLARTGDQRRQARRAVGARRQGACALGRGHAPGNTLGAPGVGGSRRTGGARTGAPGLRHAPGDGGDRTGSRRPRVVGLRADRRQLRDRIPDEGRRVRVSACGRGVRSACALRRW